MVDYSKCVIYTIRSGSGLYVGSTCNFTKRKYTHKNNIFNDKKKQYSSKLYKTIRENDGEWDMKPYKLYPCENKMDMNIEEERIRKELNADLNSNSCYGYDKEKKKKSEDKWFNKNKHNLMKKIECECGCFVANYCLNKHRLSIKHLKLLEKNDNI